MGGVARFRADGKELFTGGFDERLLMWDPHNGKLRSKYEVRDLLPQEDVAEAGLGGNQILNPPFVLGLASGGPDDAIGVALGDGAVLAIPGGKKPHRGAAPWAVCSAHSAATDAVAWLAGTKLLASAGRDGKLKLWQVD